MATSSSGLVLPSERSTRDAQVTGISAIAPLPDLTRPLPLVRLPSQVAEARRSARGMFDHLLYEEDRTLGLVPRWQRQPERERAARALLALDRNGAAVLLRDLAG